MKNFILCFLLLTYLPTLFAMDAQKTDHPSGKEPGKTSPHTALLEPKEFVAKISQSFNTLDLDPIIDVSLGKKDPFLATKEAHFLSSVRTCLNQISKYQATLYRKVRVASQGIIPLTYGASLNDKYKDEIYQNTEVQDDEPLFIEFWNPECGKMPTCLPTHVVYTPNQTALPGPDILKLSKSLLYTMTVLALLDHHLSNKDWVGTWKEKVSRIQFPSKNVSLATFKDLNQISNSQWSKGILNNIVLFSFNLLETSDALKICELFKSGIYNSPTDLLYFVRDPSSIFQNPAGLFINLTHQVELSMANRQVQTDFTNPAPSTGLTEQKINENLHKLYVFKFAEQILYSNIISTLLESYKNHYESLHHEKVSRLFSVENVRSKEEPPKKKKKKKKKKNGSEQSSLQFSTQDNTSPEKPSQEDPQMNEIERLKTLLLQRDEEIKTKDEKIKELNEENSQIKKSNKFLSLENSDLSANKKTLETEKKEVKRKLLTRNLSMSQLNHQTTLLKTQFTSVKTDLETAKKRNQSLQEQQEKATQKFQALQTEHEKIKANQEGIQKQNALLKGLLETKEKRLQDLRLQKTDLETLLIKTQTNLQSHKSKLQQQNSEAETLQKKIDNKALSSTEVSDLKNKQKSLQKNIRDLQSKISSQESLIKNYETQLQDSEIKNGDLTCLYQQLQCAETMMNNLLSATYFKDAQLVTSSAEKMGLLNHINYLNTYATTMATIIQQQQEAIESRDAQLTHWRNIIHNATTSNGTVHLESTLERERQIKEELQQKIAALEQEVKELRGIISSE